MSRSYQDAIQCLNTLQSNHQAIEAIRRSGRAMNQNAIPEMIEWVRRLGYEPADFDRLNLIHVAGTKGKGSTSAFISSILRHCSALPIKSHGSSGSGPSLQKIGLYTSPHLRFVRERIQINNEPLSEELFAKYFFETWDRLGAAASVKGTFTSSVRPVYFRFLTLMAFHTYMCEDVDAAIIECGIGGEYDSTNIIERPVVTGITSLGIDHTAVLGNAIEEIAWHKGGIMKKDSHSFTVPQPPAAMAVLEARASSIPAQLEVVKPEHLPSSHHLGLSGEFQKLNASLAVAMSREFLQTIPFDVPDDIITCKIRDGLKETVWPGRCEIRREPGMTWCIDSGHTLESIQVAGTWFRSQLGGKQNSKLGSKDQPQTLGRMLIFNQQTRDANALARALHCTLSSALSSDTESAVDRRPFSHVVFCTNTTFSESGFSLDLENTNVDSRAVQTLEVQQALAKVWKDLDPEATVVVKRSIEEAVTWCRAIAQDRKRTCAMDDISDDLAAMTLVTGSVHLVGGFLEVLETRPV